MFCNNFMDYGSKESLISIEFFGINLHFLALLSILEFLAIHPDAD